MAQKTDALRTVLTGQAVIPVVAVDSAAAAVNLARALAAGGLPAIEITLRTPAALDAIRAVASDVPEAICGAGTILTPQQYDAAEEAGDELLINSLSMLLPLGVEEKQALLEAETLPERRQMLDGLMEYALHGGDDDEEMLH